MLMAPAKSRIMFQGISSRSLISKRPKTKKRIVASKIIAIILPVALVTAPYLGVTAEVVVFTCLVVAGMPFLLLVGAAPNAIAYDSKQFTTGEFFLYGIPASIILMIVTGIAVKFIWPLMGMTIQIVN